MLPQDETLRILVIEDDLDTRLNLADILELDGYVVEQASTAREAFQSRDWKSVTAVILDRKLPDDTAENLLPRIKAIAPDTSCIVVTGYADLESAITSLQQGAEEYLLKPVNADLLRKSLAQMTERRRARMEIARLNADLQKRFSELQALFHVIPIGIGIANDVECRQISVNRPLAFALGIAEDANASASAPPGERPKFKVFGDRRELAAEELPMQLAAARGIEVAGSEIDIHREDGSIVSLLAYAAPLLNECGESRGSVGAFLDITERKRARERELQRERLAAIGETMAGLVHESRNALQRSKACLEMLELEVQDRPEALDLVKRTQNAQDHLGQLYEEVRSYAAPLKLNRQLCDLAQVWRDVWEHLSHTHAPKQIALEVHTDLDDHRCDVDRFAIEQVFRNILENAIAVSPAGSKISVICRAETLSRRPAMSIHFRDQGPGLSPEQCERIFEPFFTTKTKGTGLGMAIAHRIVDSHGGQIGAGRYDRPGAEIKVVLPRSSS